LLLSDSLYTPACIRTLRSLTLSSTWINTTSSNRTAANFLHLLPIADSRLYPVDKLFEEHPQGRCTLVPDVIDAPELTWEIGLAWFMHQPQ